MFEEKKYIRQLLGQGSLIEIINLITEYAELSHLLRQILNEVDEGKGSPQKIEKLKRNITKALKILNQRIHQETIFLEKLRTENRSLKINEILLPSKSS